MNIVLKKEKFKREEAKAVGLCCLILSGKVTKSLNKEQSELNSKIIREAGLPIPLYNRVFERIYGRIRKTQLKLTQT